MRNELCEKCGKNPWAAPVFVDTKPTERWCEDCIQTEIDAGSDIEVLGDYFKTKKQEKIMRLLDEYIIMDNIRFAKLPGGPDYTLSRIRELLVEMWGE